ncbi:HAD-IIA family hydrolase [Paenibacillus sp. IB182496]|uniref:Acid sugar phosphatase n=1 Tax=Paenibacillus sabuli TaxID=2772509 RepID=A0A927GU42_9BACL|nr:HAD-IIA family hydrolase [Paenibacillus sabuli]MBD2847966.1 HAD-IIA family hydrolase [Paenibacillus sabuli]
MEGKRTDVPQGLLIDLDGTLYHGRRMIPGADRWVASLQAAELPYLFVTNNSSLAPEAVAERLQTMGIPAAAEQVCTSAQAAAAYIAGRSPGAPVHIVGEVGLRTAAEQAGLALVEESADYVLQGIDRGFDYPKLSHAARLIRAGAAYILTNPDLLLPTEDGLEPGAGALGAMLQAAGQREPTIIGKPSPILVSYALARLGMTPGSVWMVGDNMATDIAAARRAGCGAVLVLTGVTTAASLRSDTERAGISPDLIFEDLMQLERYMNAMLRT